MGKGERPEHTNPPEIFYNQEEARKYTSNSRMIAIQVSISPDMMLILEGGIKEVAQYSALVLAAVFNNLTSGAPYTAWQTVDFWQLKCEHHQGMKN